jgi:hypothetical protein
VRYPKDRKLHRSATAAQSLQQNFGHVIVVIETTIFGKMKEFSEKPAINKHLAWVSAMSKPACRTYKQLGAKELEKISNVPNLGDYAASSGKSMVDTQELNPYGRIIS